MISGFLYQQWKYQGDPLQSLNAHVNFYRNAKESGVPSYDGPKTGWLGYLLEHQGLIQVGKDNIVGLFDLFLNPTHPFNKIFLGFHYSEPYSFFLFPFLLIGLAATLAHREYWSWMLALSFVNITASHLNDVRDPRLFYHLMPFFAYFFAHGIWTAGDIFRRTLDRRGSS